MEIKIKTIEMTQKIFDQLDCASDDAVMAGEWLGYVNSKKGRFFIIRFNDKYYKIRDLAWNRDGEFLVSAPAGGYSLATRRFENGAKRDLWWKAYTTGKATAKQLFM